MHGFYQVQRPVLWWLHLLAAAPPPIRREEDGLLFTTMRKTLARATQDFDFGMFGHQGLGDLIAAALDGTDRWHKKNCALPAQFVSYFVLAMSLFRSESLARIAIDFFTWMRAKAPELSPRA